MFLQAQEKEISDSESSLVFSLRDSQENPKNLGKKNGTCRILKVCKCQISDTFSTKQGISNGHQAWKTCVISKSARRGVCRFTTIKMIYRNRAKEVERENDIGIGISPA